MLKLAIFDMDGLIFDTERLYRDIWKPIMKEDGYILEDEIYLSLLGCTNERCKRIMAEHYGEDYPYDRYVAMVRAKLNDMADKGEIPVKEGIPELLEYLKNNDIKCAVASSTQSEYVRSYIKNAGLADFFDVVIGGEQVKKSKPEPDIFLKACELTEVVPEEALVFEDSENGIRAALNGNIRVICIPDLKEPQKNLKERLFAMCKDGFAVRDLLTKIKF